MKKIIIILFLFFLFVSCYYIYNLTENNNLYVLSIGDKIIDINEDNLIISNDFTNKDYHINDLLNIIKYNQEKEDLSIHRLLKKADILVISIGNNDLNYKLNADTKEIYTYLNNIIYYYEEILNEISKYTYKEVYILGYDNNAGKYHDIYTYINYKLNKLANKYHYNYVNSNRNNEINKFIVENSKKT